MKYLLVIISLSFFSVTAQNQDFDDDLYLFDKDYYECKLEYDKQLSKLIEIFEDDIELNKKEVARLSKGSLSKKRAQLIYAAVSFSKYSPENPSNPSSTFKKIQSYQGRNRIFESSIKIAKLLKKENYRDTIREMTDRMFNELKDKQKKEGNTETWRLNIIRNGFDEVSDYRLKTELEDLEIEFRDWNIRGWEEFQLPTCSL